ncbi:MAG TPA: 2Fe-2S iron-sulfur cluster-binding protein [Ktedonobacterales bacterium]
MASAKQATAARRPVAAAAPQASRAAATPAARPGALNVQVLSVTPASANAVTIRLVAPGANRAPAPYAPGQFITLGFSMGGQTLYRSYSLCGDGRVSAPWEITVKRQPGGAISNYLNDSARPGMILSASAPQGGFTLPSDLANGLVFVAGGSGVTPIYGMLRALAAMPAASRPRVTLHYAYRSPAEAIFARELVALDPQRTWLTQYHYASSAGQRLQPAHVAMSAGTGAARAHWYVCGPDGLRREVVAAAAQAGVPVARTRMEVFSSPAPRVVGGKGVAARIRLADSGRTLDARPGETLLETLERYGYKPEFSCRAGACGTCALRKLSGRTRGDEQSALSPRERSSGYVLACVAQPVGDITLATADGTAAPAIAARSRHTAGKRTLRVALVGATAALFIGAWNMTNHSVSASSATTSSSSSSSSSSSDSTSSGSNSTNSSSSSSSSGFTTSPSNSAPNSSTGMS